jgi:hypothetical protein
MLLGIAICAGTLFALSFLGIPWTLARAMTVVMVLAVAFTVAVARRSEWKFGHEQLHLVDLLTLATIVGYALFATAAPPSETDFIAIWGLKAATFAQHAGIDWAFLRNTWYPWDHPDYPLLLPLTFDFMTLFRGAWTDAQVGWLNIYVAVALILIVRSLLADELRVPLYASVAALAIAPLAMSPWIGLAEGPLIAFGTSGVLLARRRSMTPAALLLGAAAMTKNEGLALVCAVAIGLTLAKRFRDVPRLWPAIAIALPWLIARRLFSLNTDITSGPMFERALARLRSPEELIAAFATYTTGEPLLWIGIGLAVIIGIRSLGSEAFALGTIAFQMLFYVGAYFITDKDISWHVRWSWERIVSHMALTFAFVAVALLYRFVAGASSSEPSAARSA